MKPDGRNLTPLRALKLLRRLDEQRHNVENAARSVFDDVRTALNEHVEYGLARARRRRRPARDRKEAQSR